MFCYSYLECFERSSLKIFRITPRIIYSREDLIEKLPWALFDLFQADIRKEKHPHITLLLSVSAVIKKVYNFSHKVFYFRIFSIFFLIRALQYICILYFTDFKLKRNITRKFEANLLKLKSKITRNHSLDFYETHKIF